MIAIVDYDAGNLLSVKKALDFLGVENIVTRRRDELFRADKIILPGVGAFGKAMDNIKKYELDQVLLEITQKQIPLLGICLGLHLLFSGSEESSGVEGLNLLEGDIRRIPDHLSLKVPHIGWNQLHMKKDTLLYQGLPEQVYAYFVHSYYLQAADTSIVSATADYGVTIHASVEKDSIFACQFHPEKSSNAGLAMLKNFAGEGVASC